MKILNINSINMNSLVFSNPKQNALGGQSISVFTEDNDKLIFQSPKCLAPYGISSFSNQFSNKKSFSIDISIDSNNFINQLSLFDTYVKQCAATYSNLWFKKHLDYDTIDKLYKPSLKDGEINKFMRIKMPTDKDNNFLGDIFDKNKQHNNLDYIVPNSTNQVIMECTGIYFIPKEFGASWKVIQIKSIPPSLSNYAFIDDNSDNDEAEP